MNPEKSPSSKENPGFDDKACIGVIYQIVSMEKFVLDDMVAEPIEEGDIGAGAKLDVKVGFCGRTGKTWVHHYELCAFIHGLAYPAESNRMVFGGIAADDQDAVTVGKIVPMIGHRATTKSGPQRGHCG